MIGFIPLFVLASAPVVPPPSVVARAAVIMDAKTGKILFDKDGSEALYPASTTKIMTALLLLENTLPTDIITAPPGIEDVQPSIMHLKVGEKITAHDILYAMMLRSANDACVAIATHIAGSVPAFAQKMNDRAREIGCENTNFCNPNGLTDFSHRTTAHDLALIAREAMKRPDFQQVVRTAKYKVVRSINQKDLWMINKNKWLKKDPTADGIKTGFTTPAGQCYVGSATRNGFRVIDTLLKSKSWQQDHGTMLQWAYKNYRKVIEFKPGDVVGDVEIIGGTAKTVPVLVATNEYMLGRDTIIPVVKELEPLPDLVAPIKKKQRVAYMKLTDADGFTYRFPVYASEEVPVATMRMGSSNMGFWAVGAALAGGWMLSRSRMKGRINVTPTRSSF